MSVLRPLSALSAEEREWIGGFLGHDGVLPLYSDTAVEDLARHVGNTLLAALGRNGIGHAALVTTDDNAAVRSVYRDLGFALAEAGVELDLK